jgi:hypothetical protein
MSQSAPSPYGAQPIVPYGVPSIALVTLGTVPLGPEEPELFADAMERILVHLHGGTPPPRSG